MRKSEDPSPFVSVRRGLFFIFYFWDLLLFNLMVIYS